MDPLFLVIVAIAALTGYAWYKGSKESRMLILAATDTMERVFQPVDTGYVNIGGTVGYHFTYTLNAPFTRLEGTITTVPRHALFYLPIALWLFKREDLLLFTVYCDHLDVGLGYIVEASRYQSGRIPIEDSERLSTTPVHRDTGEFLLLWYNPLIRDRLSGVFAQLSDTAVESFVHLGYYGQESYLAVTVNPAHAEATRTIRELADVFTHLAERDV